MFVNRNNYQFNFHSKMIDGKFLKKIIHYMLYLQFDLLYNSSWPSKLINFIYLMQRVKEILNHNKLCTITEIK